MDFGEGQVLNVVLPSDKAPMLDPLHHPFWLVIEPLDVEM